MVYRDNWQQILQRINIRDANEYASDFYYIFFFLFGMPVNVEGTVTLGSCAVVEIAFLTSKAISN